MKQRHVILLFASLLTSCQAVYLPNIRNSPLFSKKGEVQGVAAVGINGLDIQAATAVTNHIAVLASYAYLDRAVTFLPYESHAWYYEGGLGYYKNFNKTCLEIFAGYGTGQGNSQTRDPGPGLGTSQMPSGPVAGTYNKIFLQPSFGFKQRMFQFVFTFRLSSVNFTRFIYIDKPLTPSWVLYIEPALTGKMNFWNNHAFCFIQLGFNVAPTKSDWQSADRYSRYLDMSTGVGFRLGGVK